MMRWEGDVMTTLEKLRITEEQRWLISSVLKEQQMSRVAMIKYLVKLKAVDVAEQEGALSDEEIKLKIDDTIDVLSRMSDEEYLNMFGMNNSG